MKNLKKRPKNKERNKRVSYKVSLTLFSFIAKSFTKQNTISVWKNFLITIRKIIKNGSLQSRLSRNIKYFNCKFNKNNSRFANKQCKFGPKQFGTICQKCQVSNLFFFSLIISQKSFLFRLKAIKCKSFWPNLITWSRKSFRLVESHFKGVGWPTLNGKWPTSHTVEEPISFFSNFLIHVNKYFCHTIFNSSK